MACLWGRRDVELKMSRLRLPPGLKISNLFRGIISEMLRCGGVSAPPRDGMEGSNSNLYTEIIVLNTSIS